MIFKKDNFWLGITIGIIAPIVGIILFKISQLQVYSFKEAFLYMLYEPGHKILSVSMSLSLLLNALFFTIYINAHKDKTAKGIFLVTVIYGLLVLILKTFG